jgi:hypothetical protein
MKSNYIDEQIKIELCDSCYMIEVSEDLKQKIDNEIEEQLKKEKYKMKKMNKKKIVIVAFAACLFVSVNCFAAGKIKSLVGGTNKNDIVKDFSKFDQEEKKLGYDVKAVGKFANGYFFQEMSVDNVNALDEAGNKIVDYKNMNITYQNAGKDLALSIWKEIPSVEAQTPTETRQINDINIEYSLDTYKFVPEHYQLTEEDNANVEKGHYYITFGSDKDEVKVQQVSSLSWEDEGVNYLLQQFDRELTIDELTDMASEIIESK